MSYTPSTATIKRLYAVSGNKCAFPKCKNSLVDVPSGKVIGRICHIKGHKLGSARYDPTQSDDERHSFENLVLMCPIHHDVIDDDEISYTVDRLLSIKNTHENNNSPRMTLDDELVSQFIGLIEGNTVFGSLIINNNQLGGQVAHQITNIGRLPRSIKIAAANILIARLSGIPSEKVKITALMGDAESYQFSTILRDLLTKAGWDTTSGIDQALFNGVVEGILIRVSFERLSVHVIGNWLLEGGINTRGEIGEKFDPMEIIVGANL